MDFHIPNIRELIDFLIQFPVIAVLLGGILFGAGFTQVVKKTYLVYAPISNAPVSRARYKATTRILSCASTTAFSLWLWHSFLTHTGGEEVLAVGNGFISPFVYDGVRALIGWKWPELVKHWGSATDDEPKL